MPLVLMQDYNLRHQATDGGMILGWCYYAEEIYVIESRAFNLMGTLKPFWLLFSWNGKCCRKILYKKKYINLILNLGSIFRFLYFSESSFANSLVLV